MRRPHLTAIALPLLLLAACGDPDATPSTPYAPAPVTADPNTPAPDTTSPPPSPEALWRQSCLGATLACAPTPEASRCTLLHATPELKQVEHPSGARTWHFTRFGQPAVRALLPSGQVCFTAHRDDGGWLIEDTLTHERLRLQLTDAGAARLTCADGHTEALQTDQLPAALRAPDACAPTTDRAGCALDGDCGPWQRGGRDRFSDKRPAKGKKWDNNRFR